MQQMQNRVTLIGHLGADLELRTLDSGRTLAKGSLATHDYRKLPSGEYEQNTQWHNIVAWGKQAEIMNKVLAKGSYVVIYGRLVHRNYEDANGVTRNVTEIVVRDFSTPKAKVA